MRLQLLKPNLLNTYSCVSVSKILIGMVQPNTNVRFTTADVINSTYFAMDLQAVLNTVDNLPSKDIGTQSSSLISLLNQVNYLYCMIILVNMTLNLSIDMR